MKKGDKITVQEFYDYITKQMTPEQALLRLLESSLISYEKLKFDSEGESVHPLHVMSLAAMDMGWQIAIESNKENIEGLCVGTDDYMKRTFLSKPLTQTIPSGSNTVQNTEE